MFLTFVAEPVRLNKPVIYLLGLELQEPTTFLTDVLVAAVCFFLSVRLHKLNNSVSRNWTAFFIAMGISASIGGFAHLLYVYTGIALKYLTWSSAGFVVLFAELGCANAFFERKKAKKIKVIAYIQFALFQLLLIWNMHFNVVVVNSLIGLFLVVTTLHLYQFLRMKIKGSGWVVAGFTISFVTTFIHAFKLSPHKWFNHNDLSHLIMIVGLYVIFVGSKYIEPFKPVMQSHRNQ